ncbi:MAG: terminase, partial [Anaerolineae bacterium]|nr:terminase [Anaerolineae bacterium]
MTLLIDVDTLIDEVLHEMEAGETYSYWQPDSRNKPQCLAYDLALHSEVMEIGYGGEAGGGKTDLVLGLASQFKQASILRREFAQMDGIIERGNEIYPVPFVEGTKKAWRFDGRVIKLGYMNRDADWKKHQGRARDFLGIDEAAEFTEKGIRSVMGWVRAEPGQRTLVVMCFNPPTTPEGEWIVKYFAPWIDPEYPGTRAMSGEVRWMAHVRDADGSEQVIEAPDDSAPFEHNGQTVYPVSRTFIRASRRDNPYLGEEYERRLDNLPEPLRTIVKDGDFTVGRQDSAWQVIPTAWVLAAQERWRKGQRPSVALRSLGVDVARGGDDKTAVASLYGTWFDTVKTYPGTQTHDGQTAATVILENHDGQAPIYIDVIGIGSSAYDQIKHKANAVPVNNAAG